MENEQLEAVSDLILVDISDKLESASLKNEYVRTLIKAVSDDWGKIVKSSKNDFHSENKNTCKTLYDVMKASNKIENLLNLSLDMLEESDYNNDQAIESVMKLKKKMK